MTNDTIQDMHRSLFSSSPPWAGAFGSMPNSRMSFTLSTFHNIDVVVMNLGRVRCCVMLCRRLPCDVKTARQFGIQACVRMSTSDPSQKGIMSPDDASPKVSKSRQTKIYQIWHGHLPESTRVSCGLHLRLVLFSSLLFPTPIISVASPLRMQGAPCRAPPLAATAPVAGPDVRGSGIAHHSRRCGLTLNSC